jgi:hypothetical protein
MSGGVVTQHSCCENNEMVEYWKHYCQALKNYITYLTVFLIYLINLLLQTYNPYRDSYKILIR